IHGPKRSRRVLLGVTSAGSRASTFKQQLLITSRFSPQIARVPFHRNLWRHEAMDTNPATTVPLPVRKMRITKVEPISLFVPLKEKIDAPIAVPHASELADVVFRGYRTTLVRIETD